MVDNRVNMDYRTLLKKYIRHVGDCEGTSFLSGWYRDGAFTDKEWAELTLLDREVDAEYDDE